MKALMLLIAALLVAAPAGAQTVIGVDLYLADGTFISSMSEAMEASAQGRAVLDMADGQDDQAVQNEQIVSHIDSGVDALAVNPVDLTASPVILEKAASGGIPVVFFNREPDASNMPGGGWYYVGAHAEQSGTMSGELMADYFLRHPEADLNGDGIIQYVMLLGQFGHQDAVLRTEYSIKAFEDAGFRVALVASEAANWRRGEAREIMTEWLASYDNIEAVFSNNDDMALGAIDALKATGYFEGGKFMPVVGVDATASAIEAMREGTLLGTVFNDAVSQGKAVVNLALALAGGKKPTEENVGYPITDGKYVWIPYRKMTLDSLEAVG